MKFAVAATFFSQSLLSWSEIPPRAKPSQSGKLSRNVESAHIFGAARDKGLPTVQRRLAFHLNRLRNDPQKLTAKNIYCDPSSTDPDIGILSCGNSHICQASLGSELGGICRPKLNSKKQRSAGRGYKNLLQRISSTPGRFIDDDDPTENTIPCDPAASSDIGILACGYGNMCKVDKSSELGGFCSRAPVTSRRLDTVDICDETSPYFRSYCDCNGLDNTTGTGMVECLLIEYYPLGSYFPTCEGIAISLSANYTFVNAAETVYTSCYEMITPYYQKTCRTVNYSASDGSCIITLNGQTCSTCSVNLESSIYDCTNVEGGGAGQSMLQVIPTLSDCLFGNMTDYSMNCTLCDAGDEMALAYRDVNVTIPGIGERSCGYLALAEHLAVIPYDMCSVVAEAAQEKCCAYQCDLCGSAAYIPVESYDIPLTLADPGYKGLTCGSFANAAYVNFSIPDGKCASIAGLIQQTCCQSLRDDECSFCDGPLANPYTSVEFGGYNVPCAKLQSFLSIQECGEVSSQVSPVCCSVPTSAVQMETPTAAPMATFETPTTSSPPETAESGEDSANGSEEMENSDAARCNLSRGGLLSSVGGSILLVSFLLIACSYN